MRSVPASAWTACSSPVMWWHRIPASPADVTVSVFSGGHQRHGICSDLPICLTSSDACSSSVVRWGRGENRRAGRWLNCGASSEYHMAADFLLKVVEITAFRQCVTKRISLQPWLLWLSGLRAGLQTKGSQVWFPVRAHAWVAGQVPRREHAKGNHTLMFLFLFFLPLLSF